MSDVPQFDADGKPIANAWKDRQNGLIVWGLVAACAMVLAATGLGLYELGKRTASAPIVREVLTMPPPPPPSHTVIEYIESTGGKEHVKGNATGASLSLSGEKVEAKDMVIAPTDMTLFDVGSLTGGAFSGSFKASVSGQMWIRILGLLVFIGCGAGAVLSFKKTPLDWHQWGGLGVGSLAGLVVAVQPELFWVGGGGLAIAAVLNFLPSRQSSALLSAGQTYDDFIESDPAVKQKWIDYRAKAVPSKDKNTIDNLIKRTNT